MRRQLSGISITRSESKSVIWPTAIPMSVGCNTERVQKERRKKDYKFTPRVTIFTSTSELSQCHINDTGEVRL